MPFETVGPPAKSVTEMARVFVRLRPMHLETIDKQAHPAYSCILDDSSTLKLTAAGSEEQTFKVNGRVFDEKVGTTSVFLETMQPAVIEATEGVSTCYITYGSSGSGKTYTLFGTLNSPGVIPSTIYDLTSHIASYCQQPPASKPVTSKKNSVQPAALSELHEVFEFSLRMSFLEIRDEVIVDIFRVCDEYEPGQRLPTLALQPEKNGKTQLPGMVQVDISSVEDAIRLTARASAFKKARDRLLGTTASHSVFRIRVEKAHCLRHEEGESEQVRVTSADITFVEVGGVESLLGNHDISNFCSHRSVFHITESLLRLSEDSIDHASVEWDASVLTLLLKNDLQGHGHLIVLATLDPADRYTPVSVPVLKFASQIGGVKRTIVPEFVDAFKSFLFQLHRSVREKSERLACILAGLSKKGTVNRRFGWWYPDANARLREAVILRNDIRREQEKILLGSDADWVVLEGARLSQLTLIYQPLSEKCHFMREILEGDSGTQKWVPHIETSTGFDATRHLEESLSPCELNLMTRQRGIPFTEFVEVPINLEDIPLSPGRSHEESLNLTSLNFPFSNGTELQGMQGGPKEHEPLFRGPECHAVQVLFQGENSSAEDLSTAPVRKNSGNGLDNAGDARKLEQKFTLGLTTQQNERVFAEAQCEDGENSEMNVCKFPPTPRFSTRKCVVKPAGNNACFKDVKRRPGKLDCAAYYETNRVNAGFDGEFRGTPLAADDLTDEEPPQELEFEVEYEFQAILTDCADVDPCSPSGGLNGTEKAKLTVWKEAEREEAKENVEVPGTFALNASQSAFKVDVTTEPQHGGKLKDSGSKTLLESASALRVRTNSGFQAEVLSLINQSTLGNKRGVSAKEDGFCQSEVVASPLRAGGVDSLGSTYVCHCCKQSMMLVPVHTVPQPSALMRENLKVVAESPQSSPLEGGSSSPARQRRSGSLRLLLREARKTSPQKSSRVQARRKPNAHLREWLEDPSEKALPSFRCRKGGAAWEVPVEVKSGGFCLPEASGKQSRSEPTKHDLYFQRTLRPWTRYRLPSNTRVHAESRGQKEGDSGDSKELKLRYRLKRDVSQGPTCASPVECKIAAPSSFSRRQAVDAENVPEQRRDSKESKENALLPTRLEDETPSGAAVEDMQREPQSRECESLARESEGVPFGNEENHAGISKKSNFSNESQDCVASSNEHPTSSLRSGEGEALTEGEDEKRFHPSTPPSAACDIPPSVSMRPSSPPLQPEFLGSSTWKACDSTCGGIAKSVPSTPTFGAAQVSFQEVPVYVQPGSETVRMFSTEAVPAKCFRRVAGSPRRGSNMSPSVADAVPLSGFIQRGFSSIPQGIYAAPQPQPQQGLFCGGSWKLPFFACRKRGVSTPPRVVTAPRVVLNSVGSVRPSWNSSPVSSSVGLSHFPSAGRSGVWRIGPAPDYAYAQYSAQQKVLLPRIVSVVKRHPNGLPIDFQGDAEKTRVVYPPENPLQIPIQLESWQRPATPASSSEGFQGFYNSSFVPSQAATSSSAWYLPRPQQYGPSRANACGTGVSPPVIYKREVYSEGPSVETSSVMSVQEPRLVYPNGSPYTTTAAQQYGEGIVSPIRRSFVDSPGFLSSTCCPTTQSLEHRRIPRVLRVKVDPLIRSQPPPSYWRYAPREAQINFQSIEASPQRAAFSTQPAPPKNADGVQTTQNEAVGVSDQMPSANCGGSVRLSCSMTGPPQSPYTREGSP